MQNNNVHHQKNNIINNIYFTVYYFNYKFTNYIDLELLVQILNVEFLGN